MVNGLGERLQKSRTILKSLTHLTYPLLLSLIMKKGNARQALKCSWLLHAFTIAPPITCSALRKIIPSLLMFPCSLINRQHFYKISLTA